MNKIIVVVFVAIVAAVTAASLYTNLMNRDAIPPPVNGSMPNAK